MEQVETGENYVGLDKIAKQYVFPAQAKNK